jgi:hypothetical protein
VGTSIRVEFDPLAAVHDQLAVVSLADDCKAVTSAEVVDDQLTVAM